MPPSARILACRFATMNSLKSQSSANSRWLTLTLFFVSHLSLFNFIPRIASAQHPTIELIALSRLGGQTGTDFDLSISSGSRTDEVDRIEFSHPGIVGKLISEPTVPPFSESAPARYGSFRVSIANDVPPGRYEVRVQGRFGLSNSRLFMVTKEPWLESSGGFTMGSAVNLPIGQIVQDECASRQRRFYNLPLISGQPIDIRLLTSSLDSRARLFVSLIDTSQRQVASAEVIENQDTRLEYRPTQSGTHTLIVSDHLFRGGPEYRYIVEATSIGSSTIEPNLIDEWRSQAAFLHALKTSERTSYNPPRLTANTATLRTPTVESLPVVHEEAEFPEKQSCPITVPSLVVGRFDSNADQDWFDFSLEANAALVIEIVSERLGELTDPQLIVYRVEEPGTKNEKLRQITIADDISNVATNDVRLASHDAVVLFTAPESGMYRLMVRDQQRSDMRGKHRYALEFRKPKHDVSAVAYYSFPTRDIAKSQDLAPTIPRHGTMAVAVAISRHDGWQGPVEIQAEGLPAGVTSSEISLAADQTNGHLILMAAPDVAANSGSFSVCVKASIDDRVIRLNAMPIEITRGPIETQKTQITRLVSKLMLAVEDRDLSPMKIQLGWTEPKSVVRGSKLKIPVSIQRSEGGKQPVIVRLRNAPRKTKANDLTINADSNEGELELDVPNDAPLGEFTCWAQCESKIKLALNPQAFDREQKRLDELQFKKSQLAEDQTKELDAAIASQQEKVKQLQAQTKLQDFLVQLPSTATRFRIVDKP